MKKFFKTAARTIAILAALYLGCCLVEETYDLEKWRPGAVFIFGYFGATAIVLTAFFYEHEN